MGDNLHCWSNIVQNVPTFRIAVLCFIETDELHFRSIGSLFRCRFQTIFRSPTKLSNFPICNEVFSEETCSEQQKLRKVMVKVSQFYVPQTNIKFSQPLRSHSMIHATLSLVYLPRMKLHFSFIIRLNIECRGMCHRKHI